jgi:hypothetical protein
MIGVTSEASVAAGGSGGHTEVMVEVIAEVGLEVRTEEDTEVVGEAAVEEAAGKFKDKVSKGPRRQSHPAWNVTSMPCKKQD